MFLFVGLIVLVELASQTLGFDTFTVVLVTVGVGVSKLYRFCSCNFNYVVCSCVYTELYFKFMYTINMFDELILLPYWYILVSITLFGAIIGSFLNVVIYRLHTGKSLSGRSHCLSCGGGLLWYDLIPLVSYLLLRGRCRYCDSCITPRYFLVELATSVLFVVVFILSESIIELVLWWSAMAVIVVVAVYDIRHLIIPDILVLLLLVLSGVWLFHQYGLDGNWFEIITDVLVAVSGGAVFAFLWLISGGKWIGLGDAKLAVPLGIFLGASSVFSLFVLSFWIGTVVSLCLLCVQFIINRGQPHLRFSSASLTIKSEIPFAPFLLLSFLSIYWFSLDVLNIMSLFV